MRAELMNILKLKELRILLDEDAILTILEIELQNTSLSVSHTDRIKFKETSNMIK